MYTIKMDERFGGANIECEDANTTARKAWRLIGGTYRIYDNDGTEYWVEAFGKSKILHKCED